MKHKLWMELTGTMLTAVSPVEHRKQYTFT
jgi:hypothetical protein